MDAMRLLEPVLAPALQRGLADRFDRAVIREILADVFARYDALRPDLPDEPSAGGRLMVNLAALTVGLYQALLGREVPEDEARALTAAVTGAAYETLAAVPTVLSTLGVRTAHQRVRRATALFRRFPFSAPSYVMEDVSAGDDVVAFDVRRCPVADYLRAQGLAELCARAWCDLDYPLAERWGAHLERSTTLADGGDRCDFRWRTPPR